MKRLVGKLNLQDPMGNKSKLMVFENREEGTVQYNLGIESLSNLQVGWRGPELPDNTYEYPTVKGLLAAVKEAVNGGTRTVVDVVEFSLT